MKSKMQKRNRSLLVFVVFGALLTLMVGGCNTEKTYPETNSGAPASGGGRSGPAPAGDRGGGGGGR